MSFITFLEEKISLILYQISFLIITTMIFLMADIQKFYIVITVGVLSIFMLGYLLSEYFRQKKKAKKIISLVDNVNEKYLISEIIKEPLEMENKAYYYALKQACKSMNDRIGELEKENAEYQEYVESFVHEIKTPISALSLALENNNDFRLKQEVDKINQLVEQMLYYARSENTEKDYFVKEIQLAEIIHSVILKYRHYMLNKKITLNVHDLEHIVITDEKWLVFIISQIIQNSIKYLDKDKKEIEVWGENSNNYINLIIKDNGCGIKESDLVRIFEKGFTGTNRKKGYSTGMGLYLTKKLCDKLGLKLQIQSKEKEFTKLTITFPKSGLHKIEN
ncbi:MAG: sensor histidine kinase [Clostridium sp.]|jgi:hypothetical protein|nr:sensor histidine kinase [Clostridium sp.]